MAGIVETYLISSLLHLNEELICNFCTLATRPTSRIGENKSVDDFLQSENKTFDTMLLARHYKYDQTEERC
jgi:hypothetical protein